MLSFSLIVVQRGLGELGSNALNREEWGIESGAMSHGYDSLESFSRCLSNDAKRILMRDWTIDDDGVMCDRLGGREGGSEGG